MKWCKLNYLIPGLSTTGIIKSLFSYKKAMYKAAAYKSLSAYNYLGIASLKKLPLTSSGFLYGALPYGELKAEAPNSQPLIP